MGAGGDLEDASSFSMSSGSEGSSAAPGSSLGGSNVMNKVHARDISGFGVWLHTRTTHAQKWLTSWVVAGHYRSGAGQNRVDAPR